MIKLSGLTKAYRTGAGEVLALDRVDLHVEAGEFVAIAGKSGSGKSTLLNLIGGIDRPTAGAIEVDGMQVHALAEAALARWRSLHVGVVFQFFQLLPTLTVLENVMLPMDFAGRLAPAQARRRATLLLEQFGIGAHADKLPAALSGGQQQRAAIARALANEPRLVIADEPTGNLDSATTAEVLGILASLPRTGATVLMVTHEPDTERFAGRVVTLRDGRVVDDRRALPHRRSAAC
ncbi:MAG: ABC transporter ATP-binding protein [Telluria sp.]